MSGIRVHFRAGRRMWDWRSGRRDIVWGKWRELGPDVQLVRKRGWHLQTLTTFEPPLGEWIEEVSARRRSQTKA